tara:strand:- start:1852 stop:2646 length:795 start_codon:yes stop_codon:yes gene_type:complete
MKILSIDVGIKNLAFCLFEVVNKNYNILKWDCINICEETTNLCSTCSKPAKFFKDCDYYCKKHAKKNETHQVPTNNLDYQKIKKLKLTDLFEIAHTHNIDYPKNIKKTDLLILIHDYINKTYLNIITPQKAADVDLVTIGKILKNKLDVIFSCDFINLDHVLIENQISPLANRMKTLQGMLTQYFIMKSNTQIQFVSSSNKLKDFTDEKTTYNERKKLGVKYTRDIITTNQNLNAWNEIFDKHNKKDDLADSFLQGIWYIKSTM